MQSLTFNAFLGSFFLQLLPHNENKCHYFLDLLRFLFIIIIIIVIIIIITVVIIVVYLFILLKIQINNKTNYKNRSLQLGLFTPN